MLLTKLLTLWLVYIYYYYYFFYTYQVVGQYENYVRATYCSGWFGRDNTTVENRYRRENTKHQISIYYHGRRTSGHDWYFIYLRNAQKITYISEINQFFLNFKKIIFRVQYDFFLKRAKLHYNVCLYAIVLRNHLENCTSIVYYLYNQLSTSAKYVKRTRELVQMLLYQLNTVHVKTVLGIYAA